MIVVDTSVWIFALRGVQRPRTIRLRQEVARGNVLVGDVVLLEILRGAGDDRHSADLETSLRRFPVVSMMDDGLAIAAALNCRRAAKARNHGKEPGRPHYRDVLHRTSPRSSARRSRLPPHGGASWPELRLSLEPLPFRLVRSRASSPSPRSRSSSRVC
ncbi:PIN domain-containing protein [Chelativorans sp.]|uniref:PIN domain-containing protein n=1 Tax=Chelativorans sp. TaxID=2203393 RepID=UPI002812640F|nr:PIN domain-containing protein [Chelativorans sp.]